MRKRKGVLDVRSYARNHTEVAIKTLQGIASCKDSPPSARVAAAVAILDRGWGKPDQQLELKGQLEQHIIGLVFALDEPQRVGSERVGSDQDTDTDHTTH